MYPAGILAFGGVFMLAFYAKILFINGGNPPKESKTD
jgi:hypothetical protein